MSGSPDAAGCRLRIWSRLLVAVAGVALAVLVPARPAAAHAVLVGSEPANGATVAVAPRVVLLRFSEDISARFSSASLLDEAGQRVDGTTSSRGGPRRLALELPAVPAGTYSISWRVLADDDGHTTNGVLVFTVGNTPRSPGGLAQRADDYGGGTPPQSVVLRWLRLCLLAGLIGGLAFAGIALRPVRAIAAVAEARRRVLGLAAAAGGLAAAVGGADLAWQARRTAPALSLLADSRWGHLWLAREAVFGYLVVLAVALRHPNRPLWVRRAQWTAAGLLAAAQVVIEALGSHAMAVEPARAAAVAAVAAHALAACVWLGGVAALAVVVARPGLPGAVRRGLLATVGQRFTVLAVGSVGLTVATGLYGAGREVSSVGGLVHSAYGRTLLLKSLVLLVVGGLGLLNAGRGLSRRLLAVEAGAGVVLLLLAGLLGETPPARSSVTTNAGVSTAVVRTGSVDDILVSVTVTPNRPGANAFTVVAASGRRPPPAPIDDVTLELDGGPGGLALREIESGRYFGTGDLVGPGPARATVVIRRAGARLTVPVEWSMPAVAPQPPRPSASGLAPFVNAMAAVVVAALAALAVWRYVLVRRRQLAALPAPLVEERIPEEVR